MWGEDKNKGLGSRNDKEVEEKNKKKEEKKEKTKKSGKSGKFLPFFCSGEERFSHTIKAFLDSKQTFTPSGGK